MRPVAEGLGQPRDVPRGATGSIALVIILGDETAVEAVCLEHRHGRLEARLPIAQRGIAHLPVAAVLDMHLVGEVWPEGFDVRRHVVPPQRRVQRVEQDPGVRPVDQGQQAQVVGSTQRVLGRHQEAVPSGKVARGPDHLGGPAQTRFIADLAVAEARKEDQRRPQRAGRGDRDPDAPFARPRPPPSHPGSSGRAG